jgi:hypothetical protein
LYNYLIISYAGGKYGARLQRKNMNELRRKPNSNIAIPHPLEALEFPSSQRQKHYRFFIRDAVAEAL